MNWYKKAEAVNAPKPVLKGDEIYNDYAKANVMFEQDGYWYKDTLENIPISQIDLEPMHKPGRYRDNMEKIKKYKSCPPIIVYFNDETGKYQFSDGIHRTHVVKELGYTHIPAIVTRKITTPPPMVPGIAKARNEEIGWALANLIKRKALLDWVDLNGTTDDVLKMNIDTHIGQDDYNYHLEVHQDDNMYQATLSGGSNGNTSGSLQDIANFVTNSIMSEKHSF